MTADLMTVPVDVVCYSGFRGAETPRVVIIADERVTVREVLDRWYNGGIDPTAPVRDYFRVRTENNAEFLLRYEKDVDEWTLII